MGMGEVLEETEFVFGGSGEVEEVVGFAVWGFGEADVLEGEGQHVRI